jgi:amidohydrolase
MSAIRSRRLAPSLRSKLAAACRIRALAAAVLLTTGALAAALVGAAPAVAATDQARVDALTSAIEPKVVAWRRDIHEHPELSNREVRTAELVAEHLKKLGLEVKTGIAHDGVVAILRGALPGPTIALRADMDALPVTEKTDLPFRSRATTEYRGEKVGVMHACGHDVHTAVLMGVAEVLTQMRSTLPGTVLFVFQPAEEGAPAGEEGGARLMLKEGIFDDVKPEAVFGLHVWSALNTGTIGYRSGPAMAASDTFSIRVLGRQSHGSRPWQGIDPIVAAAQIVNALQTVVSRRIDITASPAIVTVGAIKGGIRHNIIPDRVEMQGTIRTFDAKQREDVLARVREIAENVARANGATAEVEFATPSNPATRNDPELTKRMLPSLGRVAKVEEMGLITAAEDFSLYQQRVPGLFFFVGVTPAGQDPEAAPANHSDYFFVDERSIPVAVRALTQVALDYLNGVPVP